jgi:signal transduction histidine kinase
MPPPRCTGHDGSMQEPRSPLLPPDGWGRDRRRHGSRSERRWQSQGWRADQHERREQRLAEHARRWRGTWNGEPLRRDTGDQMVGGLAAGLARWRGFSPTTIRVVFVVAALFTSAGFIPFYCVAWLLIPGRGEESSIWHKARHDLRGITLALAVASLAAVLMVLAGVLNIGPLESYGWPQVVTIPCLVLTWRNAPEADQASLRRVISPLRGLGPDGNRRGTVIRLAAACFLLAFGFGSLLATHHASLALIPLGGVVLVLGGIVVLLGPWWLRIARDLVVERQARARAEERSDMAARIHDSVLQTLALIQRRADDPAQVTQLARAQERELRSWLFEGRVPGSMPEVTSIAGGVRQIQQDAEARHGVPVEVVTVGDCPLDSDLGALLEAAREAVVNAAKWSGASVISLYAEVTAEDVEIVVRDRGRGFDPAAVPADRKGMAESIHGRMARHGGTVAVQAAPGEGTKVSLKMPRGAVPSPGART